MRVLVTGGRFFGFDLEERDQIAYTLNFMMKKGDILGHGGAQGADSWCAEWAQNKGIVVEAFPVNHDLDGEWPGAGPRRNQRMHDTFQPHLVIAFPGNKGTASMVRIAKRAGTPLLEVTAR